MLQDELADAVAFLNLESLPTAESASADKLVEAFGCAAEDTPSIESGPFLCKGKWTSERAKLFTAKTEA